MRYLLIASYLLLNLTFLSAQDGKYWLSAAETVMRQGEKPDSLSIYLENALSYFEQSDSLRAWIKAIKTLGKIARDEQNAPYESLIYFNKAKAENLFRSPQTEEEWEELGWLYVNIGYTYNYGLEQYALAIPNYEKAKSILVDRLGIENPMIGVFIYQAFGNIHSRRGDYPAAEVLLKRFQDICLESGDTDGAGEAYSDLALLYTSMGKTEQAIQSCRDGLKIENLNYVAKGLLAGNLAKIYIERSDLGEATRFCKKSESFFQQAFDEYEFHYAQHYLGNIASMEGDIYHRQSKFAEAEKAFQKALAHFTFLYPQQNVRDIGKLFVDWADLYKDWDKFDLAFAYYAKAFKAILEDFDPVDILDNPPAERCFAENTLSGTLISKADALYAYFEQTQEIKYLEKALACHELIFEVEKQLRRSYQYETSKLFNLEDSRARSESAIKIALRLWEETGNTTYKATAFTFAERSKSILLLEAFRKTEAESIAGVPAGLLEKEKGLQADIALAEKQLYNARIDNRPDSIVRLLDEELLNLRGEYTNLILRMEAESPQYYNLKYNFATADIHTIRSQFKGKEEAFIEYFTGEENIYAFVITTTQFEVFTIPKDFALEKEVIQFRDAIEQFQYANANRQQLAETYRQLGYQLYLKLFTPFKALDLPQRLTIVPSGILGYLPFDALLTQPVDDNRFTQFPYLVREKIISYNFSATLQASLTESSGMQPEFAGFAPNFSGDGGFQALNFNLNTVEAAQRLIGGEIFSGNEATLTHFKANASNYGILHLATHAQANTAQGDFSFIVFADGKGGYDSLFVRDLYLLELHADMVVLSACETAVGKLYEGEGVISLARAFLYAGAESVVTTLWSINDDANHRLMDRFYQYLYAGQSKAEALQLAKVAQIESSDNLNAHPVYWAAFAPVGNMDAVFSPVSWLEVTLSLIAAGSLLFLLTSIWRKKGEAPSLLQRKRQKEVINSNSF